MMGFSKKIIAGFFVFLIISYIFRAGYFEKLELLFYDLKIKNTGINEKKSAPLVIVGITGDFKKKTGENFSRRHYSKILKVLKKEKAKVIGFDIFFPDLKNKKEDFEFSKTIKECGNIVLPVFSTVKISEKEGLFYPVPKLRGCHSLFANSARATGHINVILDKDQVVRKFPLFLSFKKELFPQLSIQMAKIYNNSQKIPFEKPGFFRSKHTIPIDDYGCFYLHYLPPEKIKNYFISFSDVLTGNYKKGIFREKAVIIGQTILGAKNADLIPTPYGMEFGVFVQASALYNALTDKFFYRLNRNVVLMMLFLYAFIVILLFSINRVLLNTFYLIFTLSGFAYFSFYILRKNGLFFDTMPFFFYTLSYYIWTVFYSLYFAVKKMFQKETALNILKQVEEEITNVVNPLQIVGLTGDLLSTDVHSEKLIKQTPEIALRTIFASLGIESGCFVVVSPGRTIDIIAKEGSLINDIDIEKLIEGKREIQDTVLINRPFEFNNPDIKNLMVVPIIFNPVLKIYGIFINKRPTAFSKSTFFTKEDVNLVETLALEAIVAIQNARLNVALKETQLETIFRLSMAIEYRDRETGVHIQRVSEYAGIVAEGIGLAADEIELIKAAMPLHDIGKIAIPDNVLLKPGKLTDEERKIVEKHPIIGAKMLEGSNSIILKAAEIITLYHHEKYDGTGYPFRLKGNSIPLYGRIASLADIFDALSSKRVYKSALGFEDSFEVIKKEKGKTFDPLIIDGFLKNKEKIIEIYDRYREEESVIFSLFSDNNK